MAKPLKMSLEELESLLTDRKRRIDELKRKQQSLQRDLGRISAEIETIEGKPGRQQRNKKRTKKTVQRPRSRKK